ncbi:MAG TPA: hypothetical protein VFL91_20340 [Thermomicrobiales bacterium]|nr:hypothetical protein [Thermomicrobiales bacterium]
MGRQIAVERFTEELDALLGETFERVRGIYLDRETSLFETLATIDAGEASRPVSATCASIAAQVEHVRFYLEVLERYLRGETVGKVDWQASWRLTRVTPDEWETLKGRLRDAYESVTAVIKGFETWEGENDIGGALAIVVHTAYHLGEIRQALCTVRR